MQRIAVAPGPVVHHHAAVELTFVFGPPAVGKMTVGHELCRLTGSELLHNHMTIEPVLDVFPFGSPPFVRLVGEFRRRILEEAADAGVSLVFTYVWALELRSELDAVRSWCEAVEQRGGRVRFVELYADQPTRLARNDTPFRIEMSAANGTPTSRDATCWRWTPSTDEHR